MAGEDILWSSLGMNLHTKTRPAALCALFAGVLLLSGCASSHPSSAWQGPGFNVGSSGNTSALLFAPGNDGIGNLAFVDTQGPEFGRRDHTLSSRDLSRRDELFGIRQERHPSLNYRRTFRSSRNADEYSYPSNRGGHSHSYRRGYRD